MAMYNYGSSTVYSMWSRGSFSFSLNDCSYILNERFSKTPIHISSKSCYYCCCDRYEFAPSRVSDFPSFLHGLRQSNLIQWPASKRLIFGGPERNFFRVPVYGFNRIFSRSGKRRNVECYCVNSEESSEIHCCDDFDNEDDSEMLLRLVSDEEKRGEYFGCRERSRTAYERVNREKKRNHGDREREREIRASRSVLIDKSLRNVGGERKLRSLERETMDYCKCNNGELRNGNSRFSERKASNGVEKIEFESRKENPRVDKGSALHPSGEKYQGKNGASKNSSYHSFSSSGALENETEMVDKHRLISEELSNMGGSEENILKGKVRRGYKTYGDVEKHNTEQENYLSKNAVELDRRTRPVKKMSQLSSTEDTTFVRESSQMQSRVSMARERSNEEDNATSAMSLDELTRKQNEITRNQVVDLSSSRQKYNEFREASEISTSNFGKNSGVSGKKNDLGANFEQKPGNKDHKTYDIVSEETNVRQESKSQKLDRIVNFQEYDIKRNSSQQQTSDTQVRGKERTGSVNASVQEKAERLYQTEKYATGKVDLRKTSQNSTVSVINDSYTDTATISGFGLTTKSEEQNPVLVSTSYPERKNVRSETDQRGSIKLQSGNVSQDINIISKKIIRTSEETFRERIDHGESKMLQRAKPVIQRRKEHDQTGGLALQIEQGKEARDNEESSFQASLRGSLTRADLIDKEGSNRFSEDVLIPPSSQLVTRDDFHPEKVSSHTSESTYSSNYLHSKDKSPTLHDKSCSGSGSGESYGDQLFLSLPEDALGSAARSEKSSAKFVGEFIEKARAEVSSSEIQKEEKLSRKKLMIEGEKDIERSSNRYSSVDIEMTDHDSRHVTKPAVETSKLEELKGSSETENAFMKRSGRSLWNIIGDIVRLRWGSHVETSKTLKKTGGKSSSSESNSNETWFSGREPEITNDNDTETGRIMLPDFASSDRLEVEKTSTQIGEASDKIKSENVKYHEAGPPLPLSIKGSGSKSGGNLVVSEEVLGSRADGNRLPGVSLAAEIKHTPLPLPSRSKSKYPIVENISLGETNISESSLIEPLELEQSRPKLKGGALKQRKFQRTEQVSRDRFDEWEEAYVVENEQRKMDEMFMREALVEAKKAADSWEVPVGAVLVQHGKIIARGFNLVEELRDSTAHAEMICIREASNFLKSWRLAETTLYVTLEPCPMCAGAILQARVDTLVWGAPNKLLGADGSWIRLFPDGGEGNGSGKADKPAAPVHPFHPNMKIRRGVLSSECADTMQQFFGRRRRKKEKEEGEEESPVTPSCLPVTHSSAKLLNKMHDIFHIMFCL